MASCKNSIVENSVINEEARIKQFIGYICMFWTEPSYTQSIENCSFNLRETVDSIIEKLKDEDIENALTYFIFAASLLFFLEKTCEKNIESFNSTIKDYMNKNKDLSNEDKEKLIACLPK